MAALQQKDLLAKGDYFVIGVDIEQYEATNPDKYLRGLLQDKTDPIIVEAYQSYLAVIPTSPVHFDDFAKQVCLKFYTISLFFYCLWFYDVGIADVTHSWIIFCYFLHEKVYGFDFTV